MKFTNFAIAAAAALALSMPASAATLLTIAGPTGPIASPGSLGYNFAASSGTGGATFDINGYLSLDGENCCTDIFTLNLNGTDVFQGSFDLGGGGSNVVYFAPVGSTVTATAFSFFGGGVANVFVPLAFTSGVNTLTFSYSGSPQGLGDEAWGLSNVVVTGGAVPEPASWALMIVGFGMVGAAARSRRRVAVAA